MLQVAWAAVCYIPQSKNFTLRNDDPSRMFENFDELVQRTTLNFTLNFLLACPAEFFNSEALKATVNCNTREGAIKASKDLLDLLQDWEPLGHLYTVDAFRPTLPERMERPIEYWLEKIKYLMTKQLTKRWPTIKSALNTAFNKLEIAIESPELIQSCIMKISKILIILVKRPKELFFNEPWIATYEMLVNHIQEAVDIDVQLSEKIRDKQFYSTKVPSRMVVEMGKALESELALRPLMNPKIFEILSKPVTEMLKDFEKSFTNSILNEVANRDGPNR